MTVNVRRLAADVLYRVLYEDAYSALALNQCIKEHELNPQDAAFLSALVYGVLERKFTLEYIIRQYSSVRIKKIEKKTLIILDLGIYQLLYMDKVPDSAAVNESVKLCKALRLYHSASFVNAVLRSFLRAEKQYGLPDESDRIKYLSICYSCPESIVTLWRDQYGDEMCEKILAAIPGRPPLTVRVNTLKTSDEELISLLTEKGITAEKVPFLPHALNLSRTGSLEKLNEFRKGFFYVEDAASQLCAEVLGVKAGETICDVCAAPGGKSFYSAIRMGNKGVVYSYDLHRHKLNLIDEGAARLGIDIIRTAKRDAADSGADLPACDRVLCDVPCSGLGILRRKPEIRYKTDTIIDNLPKLQYSILCTTADKVAKNCTLVYSTCTLNRVENVDVVSRFLAEHPDFAPVPIELPASLDRLVDEPPYCLTILPGAYGTDGFFIAALRKAGQD